jgi:nucleoid-associated protein YejK
MSDYYAGRPAHLDKENIEEVDKIIAQYFSDCEQNGKRPLITGIALALGFESRQSFYEYEKKKAFTYTLRKARMRIENALEQSLDDRGKATAGVIFGLKNMGWKDSVEQTNIEVQQTGARDFGADSTDS